MTYCGIEFVEGPGGAPLTKLLRESPAPNLGEFVEKDLSSSTEIDFDEIKKRVDASDNFTWGGTVGMKRPPREMSDIARITDFTLDDADALGRRGYGGGPPMGAL